MNLRILFLDDYVTWHWLRKELVQQDVICDSLLGEFPDISSDNLRSLKMRFPGAQERHDELCSMIERMTEDEVDLVIVGNNLGYGMMLAKHIPDSLKYKTIIVWNNLPADEEGAYQEIGICNFSTWLGVVETIKKVLG